MLRIVSQFAAVVLVVAFAATPVMACMAPDRQMTAEKQDCCKKMAHSCDGSVMPASHSCCQHPISPQAVNVSGIRTGQVGFYVAALVGSPFNPRPSAVCRAVHACESPPDSSLKISSILRI
jgi:hypothetical protein